MRRCKRTARAIHATLSKALDRHFLGCAAAATAAVSVGGQPQHADAAVIYSGVQNIALTNGPLGLYINLVTKTSAGNQAGSPGWDLNPYVNAPNPFFGMYNASAGTDVKSSAPGAGAGDVGKLAAGTLIGPASTFIAAKSTFMNDATLGDWQGAGAGYMGVKFVETGVNGGQPMFGWVQFSKNAGVPSGDPTGITIVDWAYDNSGAAISAGNIPEPSSLARLAVGAIGLGVRRGRVRLRRASA